MLSARPRRGSRGDGEHGERRRHMGREGGAGFETKCPVGHIGEQM